MGVKVWLLAGKKDSPRSGGPGPTSSPQVFLPIPTFASPVPNLSKGTSGSATSPPCSQALRPCGFPHCTPPCPITPCNTQRGCRRGMTGSPSSTPSPNDSSLDHSSVLRVDVRAAQTFLLETWASWRIPRAPCRPPAPPGYLRAGPVSTALPSAPLGASAQSHWGGRRHQITRRGHRGGKTGEAAPLLP